MKVNQFLQVCLASLIMSVGFSQKLSAKAFVINSTEDNSSLATNNNHSESSNLSQFFTQTYQSGQNSTTECKFTNGNKGGASVPEPTLITGLVFAVGLGIWSGRKRL
ncbi:MAG: hypothetical protein WBA93_13815 [Microcoleaceae cyanobacterium]